METFILIYILIALLFASNYLYLMSYYANKFKDKDLKVIDFNIFINSIFWILYLKLNFESFSYTKNLYKLKKYQKKINK